jgi:transcriptional regulator of aromatic amino acid metabolism
VGGDDAARTGKQVIAVHLEGYAQLVEVARQAGHVVVEAEQLATVDRDHLINAIAKKESSVKHRDTLGRG